MPTFEGTQVFTADEKTAIEAAVCLELGYQETIFGEANTETKAEYTSRMIDAFLKGIFNNRAQSAVTETAQRSAGEAARIS